MTANRGRGPSEAAALRPADDGIGLPDRWFPDTRRRPRPSLPPGRPPPPDNHWGGEFDAGPAYGNPINPTRAADRDVFHGFFEDYPDEVSTGPLRLSTCEVEALVRSLRAVPPRGSGEPGAGGTDEDDAGDGGAHTGLGPLATGFGHEPDSHGYADTSPTPTAPTLDAATVREAAAAPNPGFASSEEEGHGDDQDAHRAARTMGPAAAPPAAMPATPAAQAPAGRPPPLSAEWITAALARFPPPGSVRHEGGWHEPREPVDADPRRPQLLDLLMMESSSRTDGFRIQGADLDLLCRRAGRPPPDDHWGGEYEASPAYGNPINPTLAVDREVFHGIFGD